MIRFDEVSKTYSRKARPALDGISLTNTITPTALGRTKEEQVTNLVGILDAGFIPEED